MPRDPLDALLRVRRIALDEERRTLTLCLEAEAAAMDARAQAEAAIVRERAAAERLDAGDAAVEAFAAWLPSARERVRRATESCDRAVAETARARASLTVARGAHEAAEDALARRRDVERTARSRREQSALDETAARKRLKQ